MLQYKLNKIVYSQLVCTVFIVIVHIFIFDVSDSLFRLVVLCVLMML